MGVQQHLSNSNHHTVLFLTLMVSLILISACGAAEVSDGESNYVVPTDPPSGAGPIPTAEEVLEGMVALMESQQDLAAEAYITYEVLQDSGQLLSFNTVRYVDMRRPNFLAWTTVRDDATADEVWFANGVLTMLKHPENIYGRVEDLPSEIAEAVDVLVDEYGIFVPFSDLISGRERQVFLDEPDSKMYVGEAWIRGQWTHHLALRGGDFDIELWVSAEGDPVPLRMGIRWINEEGHPAFTARFHNWNLTPDFDESTFRSVLPDTAERVSMMPIIDDAGGEG
jgi:hypothetical protein